MLVAVRTGNVPDADRPPSHKAPPEPPIADTDVASRLVIVTDMINRIHSTEPSHAGPQVMLRATMLSCEREYGTGTARHGCTNRSVTEGQRQSRPRRTHQRRRGGAESDGIVKRNHAVCQASDAGDDIEDSHAADGDGQRRSHRGDGGRHGNHGWPQVEAAALEQRVLDEHGWDSSRRDQRSRVQHVAGEPRAIQHSRLQPRAVADSNKRRRPPLLQGCRQLVQQDERHE